MKYFGKNLAFLRKSRGMKQSEIQSGLDIQRTTWNNYENGKSFPNLQLFLQIAKYFDISTDSLLYSDISKGKVLDEKGSISKGKVLGKVSGKVLSEDGNNSKKKYEDVFDNTYNLDFTLLTHIAELIEDKDKLFGVPMSYTANLDKGLHFRFAVNTDKMYPTIKPGDFVIATYQPKALNALSGGQIVFLIDNQDKTDLKRVYYSKEVLSQFDEDDAKDFKVFNLPNEEHTFLLINDNKKYKSRISGLSDFKFVFTIVELQTRALDVPAFDMAAGMELMRLEFLEKEQKQEIKDH